MSILETAWDALGEQAEALRLVRDPALEVPLGGVLPVGSLVRDAVAGASVSASLLVARRTGIEAPEVDLDPARIATAVTSEKHYRLDGKTMNAWAELSGFWRTADGWVRTHANYPHHRARLLQAVGLAQDATPDDLRARLLTLPAQQVDDLVTAAGGIATIVRTEDEWRAHPGSAAVAAEPLVRLERIGDAPPADFGTTTPDAPAAGVRVLDLTRVIAGPVASRTLALWGADVLRVDPPSLPEPEWQHLDTGAGKRSIVLDAASDEFAKLLAGADVVIAGYRPGAVDRFGLAPDALAAAHPGLIVARLSAWGTDGPFGARRGFDSIVQAASGIAWHESAEGTPGALPAQALDHSAGYLLAAAITTALRRRLDEGGTWLAEVSLARIAAELLGADREQDGGHPSFTPTTVTHGTLTTAAPAPHYGGAPDDWAHPPVPWGSSAPEWLAREL